MLIYPFGFMRYLGKDSQINGAFDSLLGGLGGRDVVISLLELLERYIR